MNVLLMLHVPCSICSEHSSIKNTLISFLKYLLYFTLYFEGYALVPEPQSLERYLLNH